MLATSIDDKNNWSVCIVWARQKAEKHTVIYEIHLNLLHKWMHFPFVAHECNVLFWSMKTTTTTIRDRKNFLLQNMRNALLANVICIIWSRHEPDIHVVWPMELFARRKNVLNETVIRPKIPVWVNQNTVKSQNNVQKRLLSRFRVWAVSCEPICMADNTHLSRTIAPKTTTHKLHSSAERTESKCSNWKHRKRVQHNAQTCYWNSSCLDFAERASPFTSFKLLHRMI